MIIIINNYTNYLTKQKQVSKVEGYVGSCHADVSLRAFGLTKKLVKIQEINHEIKMIVDSSTLGFPGQENVS